MRWSLSLVACAVWLGGCDDAGDARLSLGRDFSARCTPTVEFCDIALTECQQGIFEATACIRRQDDAALPPVRTLDTDALRVEIAAMAQDAGALQPGPWDVALQLLGLIGAAQSTGEASVDDFVAGVAAYYDGSTGEVTIVERPEGADTRIDSSILAHEFSHVLQDRAQGLQRMSERWVRSTDTSVALSNLIEGEAVVLAGIYTAAGDGAAEGAIGWDAYFEDMLGAMLEVVEEAPAPFVTALSTLPYPVGGRLLADVRRRGGQEALEALYDDGPGFTVDWLRGGDAAGPRPGDSLPEPQCYPEPPAAGRGIAGLDSFGAAGLLGLLVGQGLTGQEALELSSQLEIDVIAVLVDVQDGGQVAVDWRLQFESDAAATEAAAAIGLPGIGVQVEGARVRLWAAEQGVAQAQLEARSDCADAAAIADALISPARAALAVRRALPLARRHR